MSRSVGVAACIVALAAEGCLAGRSLTRSASAGHPLTAPAISPGNLDARSLLGDLPDRAAHLGAGPMSLVAAAPARDNEWLGGFVDLPEDACVLAYARAATSIDDVDVAIYAEDGSSLAVDEGRDVNPTVLLCPPHPFRVYVAAHVVEGEGFVVAGVQLVGRDKAVAVARGVGAHGAFEGGPRPADAWPGLDDAVRAHRDDLGGRWDEFKRVALPVDARVPTFTSMALEPDQCIDAIVVPDDDVELLDVDALDGEGHVVGHAPEGFGARTLTLCSPVSMNGAISVRPHAGRGLAAVVLAKAGAETARDLTARPDVVWFAPTQSLDAVKRSRNATLAKSGYAAPVTMASGTLVLGRSVAIALEPKSFGPGCSRVDVVAGAPLALIEAQIWSDGDALLASGRSPSSLALFVCGHGASRLELEARGRPGPYAVLVRPETWKAATFSAHPLASSRMLARAAFGQEMLLPGRDGTARDVVLDGSHEIAWTESVGAGRCVRVVVGVQGDGAGLDLRAFDAAGGEIDRAEAVEAVAVRACAQDAPRAVKFELRASAGRLDAVIGERLETTEAR